MGTGENFLTARAETQPAQEFIVDESMLVSRAVLRRIQAGFVGDCDGCEDRLKFSGNQQSIQIYGRNVVVVCNVYVERVWEGTKLYHEGCYEKLGNPYGEVLESPPIEPTPSQYRANHGSRPAAAAQREQASQLDELLVDAVAIMSDEV